MLGSCEDNWALFCTSTDEESKMWEKPSKWFLSPNKYCWENKNIITSFIQQQLRAFEGIMWSLSAEGMCQSSHGRRFLQYLYSLSSSLVYETYKYTQLFFSMQEESWPLTFQRGLRQGELHGQTAAIPIWALRYLWRWVLSVPEERSMTWGWSYTRCYSHWTTTSLPSIQACILTHSLTHTGFCPFRSCTDLHVSPAAKTQQGNITNTL